MLIESVSKTLGQLFSPPFRSVLWKSIGLTVALLIGLWFVLETVISTFLLPVLGPWPWLATALGWLFGAGLVVAMGFLIAPVTSIFAGVFLDDVAAEVERIHYPDDPPGNPLALSTSVGIAARFFGLVLLGNLLALALMLFLGLGIIIFFLVNGYLLGREYFQFAALRHMTYEQAEEVRRQNGPAIFMGGLVISGILAIPLVNLLTPLFAATLMTHIHKWIARKDAV